MTKFLPISEPSWPDAEGILVSVVVTTYNHEAYISEAIESFLMQRTNFRVEILINDDASTDDTPIILGEYEQKYPALIKVWYQNINQYSQGKKPWFHVLFPNARGKYIAICEGDDYWTDCLKLQKQVEFLEANHDFSGVFHNTAFLDEREPDLEARPWRTYECDVFNSKDIFRKTSLFHTSSYVFRSVAVNTEFLIKQNIKSNDMLLLGVISKYGKLKFLNELMSVYRKNARGVTSKWSDVEFHRDRIELNNSLNDYFDYDYNDRASSIIKYHKNQLIRLQYPVLYRVKRVLSKVLTRSNG
ncbi:MAG: glycosyltransferase [Cytophagia bacterium]|nr:glycosyltransferase [Cytophagia bacterium]